jgi:asparagine synthase (glutamine-hydrolysing)
LIIASSNISKKFVWAVWASGWVCISCAGFCREFRYTLQVCGIVGGFGQGTSEIIYKNINLLNRRGPDHQAIKTFNNGLTLGSTRLAMTDPHPRSNQPMIDSATGNVIVFNGEIYNYKLIRKSLVNSGIIFETESDTEVLLKSIALYGIDFIAKLEGMFSFIFYEKNRNRVILARDYLGKKPLYYILENDRFFIASQVDFVKKFIKNLRLNLQSIKTYLQLGYLVDPDTMYEEIVSVLPGELIEIDLNNLRIITKKMFIPEQILKPENLGVEDAVNRALLERVSGHDKFAISLSGGVDSSIIAMRCSELGLKAQAYSMSWENSDKDRYQNDAFHAERISFKLGLNHKIIQMPPPENLDSLLTDYVLAMGEPNSNPTGISMMVLYSEIAKDNHRLVLTGDGADEVFGGYQRYLIANRLKLVPEIASYNLERLNFLTKTSSPILRKLLLLSMKKNSTEFWLYWHSVSFEKQINKLLSIVPNTIPKLYGDELKELYKNSGNGASNLMFRDLRTWLPMESNRKLDRISMWYSMEARSPYQSEKVIGIGYHLLNSTMFGKVNKELLFNSFPSLNNLPLLQTKTGFISPIGHWLRSNPVLISESLNSISYFLPFQKNELHDLSTSAEKKDYKNIKLLWSLIVLNRWLLLNK